MAKELNPDSAQVRAERARVSQYDAFVSYSHAADGKLAPTLEAALEGFAKPWYRRRSLHIFRDQTSLSATPSLWPTIETALADSHYFLLLASPDAARSQWVQQEVAWWLANRSYETLLIVLTAGTLVWDKASGDFDWKATDAMPTAVKGAFKDEPLWVDLCWAREENQLSPKHPRFQNAIAELASPLHGRPKEDLVGEDVRQHRAAMRLARGAIATLVALVLGLTAASGVAWNQSAVAGEQRDLALKAQAETEQQRDLALNAQAETEQQRDLALNAQAETEQQRLVANARAVEAEMAQRQAEEAKARAEQQARIATSRQLAVMAQTELSRHLDLALLLGRQAFVVDNTFEARNTLFRSLAFSPSLITFLRGHTGGVTSLAFSPDGSILASAGQTLIDPSGRITTPAVHLWDVRTRQPLGAPLDGRTSVAFSPDGKTLLTGYKNTLALWDVDTHLRVGAPFDDQDDTIVSLAFSPDGETLGAAWRDDFDVEVWDVGSRRRLERMRGTTFGRTYGVRAVAFSPDGTMLAAAGEDGLVRLWDANTRRPLSEALAGHAAAVTSVTFSPDSKLLASASLDKTVLIWDTASKEAVGDALSGHTDEVNSVAFSRDGNMLASGGTDRTVRLWDVRTRQPLGEPLVGAADSIRSVLFSPDGKTLASGSMDTTVQLWDLSARLAPGTPLNGNVDFVSSVAFSGPDGKILASGGQDRTVRLWDTDTRQPLGEPLLGHSAWVQSVGFSHDGMLLASAGRDSIVRLWDMRTREPLNPPLLGGHTGWINTVHFSPDGTILASASDDHSVRLWDMHSRTPIGEPLIGHNGVVTSVAFSPDSSLLASASADKTLRLWDVHTRQPVGEPLTGHKGSVNSVVFSPDGKTVASGSHDQTVRFWDVASHQPLGEPLIGHGNVVTSVSFVSSDGSRLASASYCSGSTALLCAGSLRVWDANSRQPVIEPLFGHTSGVLSIAFSPDGKRLASAGSEKTIWLWDDMSPDSWRERACRIANRNMRENEWIAAMGDGAQEQQTCPGIPATNY